VSTEIKPLFNHDLLTNTGDVRAAHELFPMIADVLDWPKLREAFAPNERTANLAKTKSRRNGVLALAVALVALWLAVLESGINALFPGRTTPWILTIAVAIRRRL
jgi:hypothetical protein